LFVGKGRKSKRSFDHLPFCITGKKTIFVTGFPESVKEQELLQAFVTFGS
jgi:hypothetical protein